MNDLILACSTVADGSMKIGQSSDPQAILANRQRFLASNGIAIDQTVLVPLTYGGDNYRRYFVVDEHHKGKGIITSATMEADGLVTQAKGVALFLPLADCIGAVLYDPITESLMVTHLGRHNLEQHGGAASVEYMAEQYGSNPSDITAWLSPAAGGDNYPLFAFANRSMHDVAIEQLEQAGIKSENIMASSIDTTTDENYFSHSQFLKGERETDGRFAIVAMMKNNL